MAKESLGNNCFFSKQMRCQILVADCHGTGIEEKLSNNNYHGKSLKQMQMDSLEKRSSANQNNREKLFNGGQTVGYGDGHMKDASA